MDRLRRTFAGALALALLAGGALAAERGRALEGIPYVMGGIGLDEVEVLQQERGRFSLWVRTALRGSGEYLADVQLLVADAQGRILFNQALTGPWLLIDLPPGTYSVQASWHGERQVRSVNIPPGALREAMFYFEASD